MFIEEPGPGAGFAGYDELLCQEWRPEGFYLGQSAPEIVGSQFDVGIQDDRSVFVVAGTGGGKGISLLVPNLIGWPGGAFVLDVKGELASFTAMRRGLPAAARGTGTTVRKFLGQTVAVLDPMGGVHGPARVYRTAYNPLAEIDVNSPDYSTEVDAVTRALTIEEKGTGQHFTDMARILMAGVLDIVLLKAPPHTRNLTFVRDIMVRGQSEYYLEKASRRPLCAAALGALRKAGDDEAGSFQTTIARQWDWLNDARMEAQVRGGPEFSIARTIQDGGSVYVSLPVSDLTRENRWLRLMLAMAIRAKLRSGVYQRSKQATLFVIDEMPVLGHMAMLEEGVAFLRGYGVKFVSVVQNIGQLKELYNKNWQTFIGNAGAICAFSMNDGETADYISHRLGSYEFIETSYSEQVSDTTPRWTGSRGLIGTRREVRDYEARASTNVSRSRSTSRKVEPVLRPEQVQRRTARETWRMIVVPADGRPLMLARVPYFARFSPEWYDTENNIRRIESTLRVSLPPPEKR